MFSVSQKLHIRQIVFIEECPDVWEKITIEQLWILIFIQKLHTHMLIY